MNKSILLSLFLVATFNSLFPSTETFAASASKANEKMQKSLQVPLSLFGHSSHLEKALPEVFQVLVWNTHKETDKQLLIDFSSLSKFVSLALFQEAIDQQDWTDSLGKENLNLAWSLARAFETQGYHTGVATGSQVETIHRMGYRTAKTEPVTGTPKTMLLTDYRMSNGQILRVLNVHGINFVTNSIYSTQIDQIVDLLKDHEGPLMVAGDFNTWNEGRTNSLMKSLKALGLQNIELEKHGLFQLDHVFVRGLHVLRKKVYKEIDSSDHKPILVELTSL